MGLACCSLVLPFWPISPAKAHAAPAIYISNNMDSGDLSTVDVEVQISAVMTAKGYVSASTVLIMNSSSWFKSAGLVD